MLASDPATVQAGLDQRSCETELMRAEILPTASRINQRWVWAKVRKEPLLAPTSEKSTQTSTF